MRIEEQAQSHRLTSIKENKRVDKKMHSSQSNSLVVQEQKSNILFELGSLKVELQKESRTTFQDQDSNRNELEETTDQHEVLEKVDEVRQRSAEVSSYAKKKVDSLFKPHTTSKLIDIKA